MRVKARYWAVAIGLSVGVHVAVFANSNRASQSAMPASAGAPAAIWGIAATQMVESVEPVENVPEPIQPQEQTEVREVDQRIEMKESKELAALPQALSETAPSVISESPVEEEIPTEILEPVQETKALEPKPEKEPKKKKKKKSKVKKRTASRGGPIGQRAGNLGRSSNSGAGRASTANYSSRVLAHLRRHKRHPGGRASGTVRMVFVLGSNGSLRSVRISGRSGNASLDSAALAMVRRASPFPSFPAGIGKSSMTFSVPVRFSR